MDISILPWKSMWNTSCYEFWFRVKKLNEEKMSDLWSICLCFPSISSFSREDLQFPPLQSWHCGCLALRIVSGNFISCQQLLNVSPADPELSPCQPSSCRRWWKGDEGLALFRLFLIKARSLLLVKILLLKLDRLGFNLYYRLCFSCVLVMRESCISLSGKDEPLLNSAWGSTRAGGLGFLGDSGEKDPAGLKPHGQTPDHITLPQVGVFLTFFPPGTPALLGLKCRYWVQHPGYVCSRRWNLPFPVVHFSMTKSSTSLYFLSVKL